jgi:hypothetical protein
MRLLSGISDFRSALQGQMRLGQILGRAISPQEFLVTHSAKES